jgi:chromosome segregation protein
MADNVGLISTDQAALLMLLRAMTNDKKSGELVDKMLAARDEAQAKLDEAGAVAAQNAKAMAEARNKLAEAEQKVASLAERARELDEREAKIAEVSAALTAEKRAWEAVRQKVGAEQAAREVALRAGEARLHDAEQAMALEMIGLRERSEAAEKMRADYHARHARMMRAMDLSEDA